MDAEPPLVLIAEDDPLASMALRAQLEALSFRVLGPARDGVQAVALGRCYPADLALFDLRMPGRSGIEAAFDLFEAAPTPVVLLTGSGSADLPEPVPLPPIFGVLSKPADLADLGTGLGDALARFRGWVERERRSDVRHAREQRILIGRAVDRLAEGPRKADASLRFLERVREEGTDPVDLACSILAEAAP